MSATTLALRTPETALPSLITAAGDRAQNRYIQFFAAEIRNANTRAAYLHAVEQFLGWMETLGVDLLDVAPLHVAAYIEKLCTVRSAPTVKQHLAGLRSLFDYLVVGQVMPFNPAAAVRGPKYSVREGKTPILSAEDTRELFARFDPALLSDVRDRAILGVMVYSFARVSAVIKLRVKDYQRQGMKAWLALDEKGGKHNRVPAHHQVTEDIEYYLQKSGLAEARDTPLFRSLTHRGTVLSDRALRRENVYHMIQRRMTDAGIGCHSFRGTGITNFLEHGGTLETAARIAGHASTKTTQLYDRRNSTIDQGEIERIRF